MHMITLTRRPVLSDEECEELAGEFLGCEYYDTLITEDADVFRPDGSALLHFRKRRINKRDGEIALRELYEAATEYGNRGLAAGKLKYHKARIASNLKLPGKERLQHVDMDNVDTEGTRMPYQKQDGTMSKTNVAATAPSGIVGAFDRSPRFPHCRLSKFTTEHYDRYQRSIPFIQQVNDVFRTENPSRHAAQKAVCEQTHPDYIIPGTVFTTITVNKNWRTALHQDAGDLRSGFGVLSVLSEGRYEGGYFVIPKYGIAVDMQHTDVLLADVHEWHCNTELVGVSKYWTRLSTVFYYRSKIIGCTSLDKELEIAKNRREGTPMYPDFKGEWPV